MATPITVPSLGESVTQAVLLKWYKKDGDSVASGEPVCELETDKANADLSAPVAGILRRVSAEGDTVKVGGMVGNIDAARAGTPAPAATASATAQSSASKSSSESTGTSQASKSLDDLPPARTASRKNKRSIPRPSPAPAGAGASLKKMSRRLSKPAPRRQRRVARADSRSGHCFIPASNPRPARDTSLRLQGTCRSPLTFDERGEARAPMSKLRKRIAENLVKAQQTAAILTTFNEVDMQAVMDLRTKWKEEFQKAHSVGLGFMSFFAKAVVQGLREFPNVNAFVDGDNFLYHQNIHLGIAVSTERGLAVPVLKNAQDLSFAQIETEIKRLATSTRDGKLGLEELSGGTFTITNGGVFGSLLSTPIINPPQSGILGMHTIQKRPVVINDKIEIRPMMYLALSYDHRIVDGKDAIGFLVRVKQLIEDPARLLLEV